MIVLTAISKSVPDNRRPSLVASTRIFESTGNVVFEGMLAATAPNPSCSFSRVIVNFILDILHPVQSYHHGLLEKQYLYNRTVVVVERVDC